MAAVEGAGRLLSQTTQQAAPSLRMDSLTNAVAGSLASVLAFSLVYPLDQLRTFQQVEGADRDALESGEQCAAITSWYAVARRIYVAINVLVEKHGVGVLYRGLRPMLISMSVSNFVYFYTHSWLSGMLALYKRRTGRDLGYLGQLGVNSMAGVINVLVTTPLWTASVRAKLSSDREAQNVLRVLRTIHEREGLRGLWSGTVPSLFLVCNPAIQFLLYGIFKTQALALRKVVAGGPQPALSSAEAFVFGAAAKGCATVFSYPLQVAQTRLRAQENVSRAGAPRAYKGTVDCLADIMRRRGFRGWFAGLESKLLATVLTSALMFMIYERLREVVREIVRAPRAPRKAFR